MITKHYKLLVCSGESFKAMRAAMAALNYEARMERGFVVQEDAQAWCAANCFT